MPEPSRHRSVSTVVLRDGGRDVLLHLRGDIHLWSLPGGGVEPDEDWEAAAVREVMEETGYEVTLDRLVGEYHRPQIGDTKRLFVGHVTGGEPRLSPPESIKVTWFPVDRLPFNRLPLHKEYVKDAAANQPEIIRKTQFHARLQEVVMQAIFAFSDLRDCIANRF